MDSYYQSEAFTIAAQVARTVHRKYHTYFAAEDVKQECILWCIRRDDKVTKWLDPNQNKEDLQMGIKSLAKTLTRHADRYCRKRKAQMIGYETQDEVFYSRLSLSEILPFVWTDITQRREVGKPHVSSQGNAAEGGGFLASVIDVRAALEKLEPQDQMILQMRYYESLTLTQIADELGISVSTANRKVKSAMREITNKLGGYNPWSKDADL